MRPRIKICGLRTPAAAHMACLAGADALGLVFYPPSPRAVTADQAAAVRRAVPPFVTTVGLFVNASAQEVEAVLSRVALDVLQFHGDETPAQCAQFGKPWIKALRVQPETDLLECAARYAGAQGLLLDAYSSAAPGGTGERFDWGLIPPNLPLPWVLSGGLTPSNVAQAIARTQPWAVDVSSGVERQRGEKDPELMHAFVDAVRAGAAPDAGGFMPAPATPL